MTHTMDGDPRRDGYRMPGEFEPHSGCWMLWPERPDNWRLGGKPAQQAFVAVASAIAGSEPVSVGVSAAQYANARRLLPPAVRVIELSSNDAWMRDVGPTFVVNDRGGVRGVDWMFNAWGGLDGGLYFPWDRDNAVAGKVLEIEGRDRYRAPFVLEGGAIHVDGQGTLVTTEECLLNRNRNPQLSREEIEGLLRRYLKVEAIVWLGKGTYMDETDGHVDNLCAYVKPAEVVLNWTDDRSDPQYESSRDAYERLMEARDSRDRRFKVHKLVQPGPLYMTPEEAAGIDCAEGTRPRQAGDWLAGSYVNFYLGTRRVVVPLLDARRDGKVLRKLKSLFPGREVVGVPGREILLGGGNVHCITQQVPAARDRRRTAPAARRR